MGMEAVLFIFNVFEEMAKSGALDVKLRLPDGSIDWPTFMEFGATEAGQEVLRGIEDIAQRGYPMPKRGNWGDKHPCELCGKYGAESRGSRTVLCRQHVAWWDSEAAKYAQEAK